MVDRKHTMSSGYYCGESRALLGRRHDNFRQLHLLRLGFCLRFLQNRVPLTKFASRKSASEDFMKKLLAVVLCVAMPILGFASDNGYKVNYDGGSLPNVKAGTGMRLVIEANQIRLVNNKNEVVTIPASSVTEISYGQDVHRRVGAAIGLAVVSFGVGALMALTKSKKHYVGLTWADGDQKGGFAMQCDKNDYRGLLAGLEGVTGKKAVNSDAMTVKN